MTWRRLNVLAAGLSPDSLWVHLHREAAKTIDDPDEAEQAVHQLLG
jgi:hypothetical protein